MLTERKILHFVIPDLIGNPVTILSHSLSGLSGHPSAEGQAADPGIWGKCNDRGV